MKTENRFTGSLVGTLNSALMQLEDTPRPSFELTMVELKIKEAIMWLVEDFGTENNLTPKKGDRPNAWGFNYGA